jgi:hypothetical protein
MASRSRTTFKKRQKEIARMEKQRDKAAKRMQRKADKAAGIVEPDEDMDLTAELETEGDETPETVESADSHTI